MRSRAEPARPEIEAGRGWRQVYDTWFPPGLDQADLETQRRMVSWWFRSRADAALPPFVPLVAAARAGQLNHWLATPVGRLLLVVLLDPIGRSLFAGRPEAHAGEALALRLAEEGLRNGQYEALARPWEKVFLFMPLAQAEGRGHAARLDRAVTLAEQVVLEVPAPQQPLYWFVVGQIRAHQDVIARFGRFPQRNASLGRASTPAERAHLDPDAGGRGQLPPRRSPGPAGRPWRLSGAPSRPIACLSPTPD
jgi:uncharacterized protein (DUF924 family)